jgi:hypothetical protein
MAYTEEALRSLVDDYDEGKRQLLARRDQRIRDFYASGWRPVDLQRITGYSRETIRHALHPEVRQATNAGRRKTARPEAPPRVEPPRVEPPRVEPPRVEPRLEPRPEQGGYGDRKPYVVADALDDLRGPTRGTVTLPQHLDWSGSAVYDLDRPARLASMYKAVLNEARGVEDLRDWLDRRALFELWPALWLPPRLRAMWEARFPELAARRPEVA